MSEQQAVIKTLSDLYQHLDEIKYAGREYLYRGHEDDTYKLVSTIGRTMTPGNGRSDFKKRERRLLNEFKRYAVKDIYNTGIPDNDDIEWLILGRHHGLPTRLIDFSTNPLVALYFACKQVTGENGNDANGCLWIMTGMRDKSSSKPLVDPWKLQETTKYRPKKIHGRILAQSAIVIIPKFVGKCLTEDPSVVTGANSVKATPNSRKLIKLVVPAESKLNLRIELERSGVDEARLFPGLSGIARAIADKDYFFAR